MSEPLSDGARRLITDTFGLPVTNNYASGECMALSTGCPQGHGMHLQADWAILEVVNRHNEPVAAGEPGEKVLLTNLYNTVQPFIRYETGRRGDDERGAVPVRFDVAVDRESGRPHR